MAGLFRGIGLRRRVEVEIGLFSGPFAGGDFFPVENTAQPNAELKIGSAPFLVCGPPFLLLAVLRVVCPRAGPPLGRMGFATRQPPFRGGGVRDRVVSGAVVGHVVAPWAAVIYCS